MPDKIDEQMAQIGENIKYLDQLEFDSEECKIADLKLKFVIAEALIDIRHQLFEINHYGIGTD